ncbi:Hemolysin [Klebsiella pneumoniae]|uniref:Hemolysin n=1 Tax=Klebsiella pneumoniae TaxID=573 RepID=A0A377UV67_KLEPN|nr:Hemolysin [Klebsiella pneumoniae]
MLEGYPEVWINGYLWKLEPGDSVGFPAGTGICHTFLNNTEQEVRLLVVGEANKKYNPHLLPAQSRLCRDAPGSLGRPSAAVLRSTRRQAAEKVIISGEGRSAAHYAPVVYLYAIVAPLFTRMLIYSP